MKLLEGVKAWRSLCKYLLACQAGYRRTMTDARTAGLDQDGYIHGDLRIDPAPCWNRDGTQFVVTGIDDQKTRQMFVIDVKPTAR